MKIYDIIKLNEALDIRRVEGGYEVFDNETGRRSPNTIVYPSEGSAEEARDRARARQTSPSQNRQTPPPADNTPTQNNTQSPTREKPPVEQDDLTNGQKRRLSRTGIVEVGGFRYTREEINNFTERARIRRAQAKRDRQSNDTGKQRRLSFIRQLIRNRGSKLSIATYAAGWLPVGDMRSIQDEFRDQLELIATEFNNGVLVDHQALGVEFDSLEHRTAMNDQFEKAVSGAYIGMASAIVAKTLVIIATAGPAAYRVSAAIIRLLWTLRLGITAAAAVAGSWFAGVGGIVTGLVAFAATTGAIWAVEELLEYAGFRRWLVGVILGWSMNQDRELLQGGEVYIDIGASAIANVLSEIPGETADNLEAAASDARNSLTGRRDLTAQQRRALDALEPGSEANNTNRTTTTPGATNNSANGATVDINGVLGGL